MTERTPTPIEERGYVHPDVLVSTDWVAEHLEDPEVRIIESDEDLLLYSMGHVPGAVRIDWRPVSVLWHSSVVRCPWSPDRVTTSSSVPSRPCGPLAGGWLWKA